MSPVKDLDQDLSAKTTKVNSWVDKVADFHQGEEKVSLFKEFSQNATVHGLRRTADGHHGMFRRGFWCVAFLGMLSGLLYTVFSQVVSMMSYPTLTQQNMEFTAGPPFPAVTLCNLNTYRKSGVSDNPGTREFLLALSDLGQVTGSIDWNSTDYHIDSETAREFEKYLEYIAHPLTETLVYCRWDNKVFPCEEIFKLQKTDFGLCYTFNGREGLNSTPRRAFNIGSKYGLTIIANIQEEEYLLGANSDAAGLRVLLHDHHETPLVEGRGFEVMPGTSTKGSIKLTQINFLPPPFTSELGTKCTNTSAPDFNNTLRFYDNYDMSACISECRYNYVFKECGCRNIFDRGNDTLCQPRLHLECYAPRFDKFMDENLYIYCDCPMPCHFNIYDAEVSMSGFPSSAFMAEVNRIFNISLTESQFRRNYLKLTLSYDTTLIDRINQVPEYTFEKIMSTLGGQLGIFIGASLLSLLEFLEFGLELLFFKLLGFGKVKPKP